MEDWYAALMASGPEELTRQFLSDYEPHASVIGGLDGRVLDVGGGAGVSARFLPRSAELVIVDPLPLWSSDEWRSFSRAFRGSGPEPTFSEADAEQLPFADAEFDAVISFWALNHMRNPARCVGEIARTLKLGGVAYFVVDDIEPKWRDLAADGIQRLGARVHDWGYRAAIQKPLRAAVVAKLTDRWPIAPDHLPITERDLMAWADRLRLTSRKWIDGSLALRFEKSA
jgi:ubiquinone/menaquinone biosynthesis C-methylase UbiE